MHLDDGHHEIAIPWKLIFPICQITDHLPNVVLSCYDRFSSFMLDLLNKGYTKRVPENRCLRYRSDSKVWYLLHHSVVYPQKPDKVRVVFDCAATCCGMSLNGRVLQCLDVTNKLVDACLDEILQRACCTDGRHRNYVSSIKGLTR